jgi:hypothetical protein
VSLERVCLGKSNGYKINLQKVAKTSKAHGNIKFQSAGIMLTGDGAVGILRGAGVIQY